MTNHELPPTLLVIFGITGDLSSRKLLPALAEIHKAGQLPHDFRVLGISRRHVGKGDVLDEKTASLEGLLDVHTMALDQFDEYVKLKHHIETTAAGQQVIFYFAVPPAAVLPIVEQLGSAGLNGPHTKLLLEKPFGVDLQSAQDLIEQIDKYYKEDQVFRIDHYLAKEMAQNITVFLGSNTIFRNLWSNHFIERIRIQALEEIGIEGRDDFYEQTGILRDLIQSHLMQMAALVLMEPCADVFDFDEIPKRRLAALKKLEPVKSISQVVRGQYEGYRQEVGNPHSMVETFAMVSLKSSDSRWEGVPIHLVAGKKLNQKLTQISVHFKKTAASSANTLIFRIYPDEAIEVDLWVKEPGYERKLEKLKLDFKYGTGSRLPEAYEMVIVDALRSNHSLFASSAEVLSSWRVLQPVLNLWQNNTSDLKIYKPGTDAAQILS